ncbi:MAG: non-homologous end-joining DNA ligase [Vicinamibacterales bacterium]
MAEWYRPQLAVLVDTPPAGDAWLHEIKFDGYRAGCEIRSGTATLTSRNGVDLTRRFPAVARAAALLPVTSARLDGEVVALLPDGRSSFSALHHGSPASRTAPPVTLAYMAFDAFEIDGARLDGLPLAERKARLEALVARQPSAATIRYSSHVVGSGPAFFAQARQLGLEGVISKRADLPWRAGRSDAWRKAKCTRGQELVIGGFTDQVGTQSVLGSLLVGWYDGDALVYAGGVGTGWSVRDAIALRQQLERLVRKTPPFARVPDAAPVRTAHWVEPRLVAQVAFTEWTPDGMVRHAVFHGLRPDRAPEDVRREDASQLD